MKSRLWFPFSAVTILLAASCANKVDPNDPNGYGPFDAAGNYREDWADDPSKWTKPGKRKPSDPSPVRTSNPPPFVAQNEQPPIDSLPIVTKTDTGVTSVRDTTPTTVAVNTQPAAVSKPIPKPQTTAKISSQTKQKTKTETASRKLPSTTASKKKTATVSTKSKTATKTTAKTKPKPKPANTRYTVKSGDSLSRIASRNGTTVGALQRANGISGSVIRPGQSLVIPKR